MSIGKFSDAGLQVIGGATGSSVIHLRSHRERMGSNCGFRNRIAYPDFGAQCGAAALSASYTCASVQEVGRCEHGGSTPSQ
jgi:hypothetical protein